MILNSILALSLVLTTVSGQSNFRKGSPSLHEDIPLYHSSDRHAILQQQGKTFVEDIDEAIAHADNLERRRLQDGADEGSPAEYPFVVCHQDPNILGGERRQVCVLLIQLRMRPISKRPALQKCSGPQNKIVSLASTQPSPRILAKF